MKTPYLKKCPFCASGARIMFSPGIDSFYAECGNCGARTQGYSIGKNDEAKVVDSILDCIEAAANAWNMRRWLPE